MLPACFPGLVGPCAAGAAQRAARGTLLAVRQQQLDEKPADAWAQAAPEAHAETAGDRATGAGGSAHSALSSVSCREFLQEELGQELDPENVHAEVVAERVLSFLRGVGPAGVEGRTLEVVLLWDYDRLESVHDFIQWLFPTDEPSKAHPEAPVLTRRAIGDARRDPVVLSNINRGLRVFLKFLGLEWGAHLPGRPRIIQKARGEHSFAARAKVAWNVNCAEGNHNWKRVSRMLTCLRLLGMHSELKAVYSRLERLWARGRIPAQAGMATEHWRTCAGDPLRRPMPKHGSSLGITHTLTKYAGLAGCPAGRGEKEEEEGPPMLAMDSIDSG